MLSDIARDIVLQGEQVSQIALVGFGPNLAIICRLNKLRGDANTTTDMHHRAFHDSVHV